MDNPKIYKISKNITIYTYLNVILIRKKENSIAVAYLDNRIYNETIKLLSFLTGIEIS